MKFILKLLFAPVIMSLTLWVFFSSLILHRSAWVFGIAGTILGILGVAILVFDNLMNGMIVLIFAFLASPLGIPMLLTHGIGLIQKLRFFIKDTIYN